MDQRRASTRWPSVARVALVLSALVTLTLAPAVANGAKKPPGGRGGSDNGPDSLCNQDGMECVVGGSTTLTLSSEFKKYLKRTKTRLKARDGATRDGNNIAFPVSKNGPVGPIGNPRSNVYQQGFLDETGSCHERLVNVVSIHHSGVLELSQRVRIPATGRRQRVRVTISKPWLLLEGSSSDQFGDIGVPASEIGDFAFTASPVGGDRVEIRAQLRTETGTAPFQRSDYFRRPSSIPLGTTKTTAIIVPKTVCNK